MRYQSREFHKFFWGINCCSYNTHGFHGIFASREKICEMRPKIFAFFLETFRSLETLISTTYFQYETILHCTRYNGFNRSCYWRKWSFTVDYSLSFASCCSWTNWSFTVNSFFVCWLCSSCIMWSYAVGFPFSFGTAPG